MSPEEARQRVNQLLLRSPTKDILELRKEIYRREQIRRLLTLRPLYKWVGQYLLSLFKPYRIRNGVGQYETALLYQRIRIPPKVVKPLAELLGMDHTPVLHLDSMVSLASESLGDFDRVSVASAARVLSGTAWTDLRDYQSEVCLALQLAGPRRPAYLRKCTSAVIQQLVRNVHRRLR